VNRTRFARILTRRRPRAIDISPLAAALRRLGFVQPTIAVSFNALYSPPLPLAKNIVAGPQVNRAALRRTWTAVAAATLGEPLEIELDD
jgi:hypothetical protein